ncbi:MAG: formylglycine-generating enzyme family protein, partial [Bacteroidales bacterium]|nr:formylglycine-generating enzyme family protein [Bacteroidales bacterium]
MELKKIIKENQNTPMSTYHFIKMKQLLFFVTALVLLAGCGQSNQGELVGVRKKSKPFYQPDPYGMVFIPQGSFTMGAGGEDITYGQLNQPRKISVSAFFMDETEITNNEYREFVYYVRDSIARTLLGEIRPETFLIEENAKTG